MRCSMDGVDVVTGGWGMTLRYDLWRAVEKCLLWAPCENRDYYLHPHPPMPGNFNFQWLE